MSQDTYSWDFHIVSISWDIAIGFVSNLHHQNVDQDWEADHAYLFCTDGWISMYKDPSNKRHGEFKIGKKETLTLIMNMDKGHLEAYKNGNAQKTLLFDKVIKKQGLKYRLALSIYKKGDSIRVRRNSK